MGHTDTTDTETTMRCPTSKTSSLSAETAPLTHRPTSSMQTIRSSPSSIASKPRVRLHLHQAGTKVWRSCVTMSEFLNKIERAGCAILQLQYIAILSVVQKYASTASKHNFPTYSCRYKHNLQAQPLSITCTHTFESYCVLVRPGFSSSL